MQVTKTRLQERNEIMRETNVITSRNHYGPTDDCNSLIVHLKETSSGVESITLVRKAAPSKRIPRITMMSESPRNRPFCTQNIMKYGKYRSYSDFHLASDIQSDLDRSRSGSYPGNSDFLEKNKFIYQSRNVKEELESAT